MNLTEKEREHIIENGRWIYLPKSREVMSIYGASSFNDWGTHRALVFTDVSPEIGHCLTQLKSQSTSRAYKVSELELKLKRMAKYTHKVAEQMDSLIKGWKI